MNKVSDTQRSFRIREEKPRCTGEIRSQQTLLETCPRAKGESRMKGSMRERRIDNPKIERRTDRKIEIDTNRSRRVLSPVQLDRVGFHLVPANLLLIKDNALYCNTIDSHANESIILLWDDRTGAPVSAYAEGCGAITVRPETLLLLPLAVSPLLLENDLSGLPLTCWLLARRYLAVQSEKYRKTRSKTSQGKAKQSKAKQIEANQTKAKQSKAKQSKVKTIKVRRVEIELHSF
ncbi:hypothetical protein V1478_006526 [Vespula squamosa]|uniref:Uncharacterized protein n=1 Tax=Vespula squamosa TaxID=30214 RepID=A0ABD2B854_VESSQ